MKSYCPNCSAEYNGKAFIDELGPHVACKECGSSWDVGYGEVALKDIDFNELIKNYRGISVFEGKEMVAEGFFTDVLLKVGRLAERKVISTNTFFDVIVILLADE